MSRLTSSVGCRRSGGRLRIGVGLEPSQRDRARVDPTTNRVIASVNVSPPGAAGPNSISRGSDFHVSGLSKRGEIVRIDPVINKVSGALAMPGTGCHTSQIEWPHRP
jgi:hypothetical protein